VVPTCVAIRLRYILFYVTCDAVRWYGTSACPLPADYCSVPVPPCLRFYHLLLLHFYACGMPPPCHQYVAISRCRSLAMDYLPADAPDRYHCLVTTVLHFTCSPGFAHSACVRGRYLQMPGTVCCHCHAAPYTFTVITVYHSQIFLGAVHRVRTTRPIRLTTPTALPLPTAPVLQIVTPLPHRFAHLPALPYRLPSSPAVTVPASMFHLRTCLLHLCRYGTQHHLFGVTYLYRGSTVLLPAPCLGAAVIIPPGCLYTTTYFAIPVLLPYLLYRNIPGHRPLPHSFYTTVLFCVYRSRI